VAAAHAAGAHLAGRLGDPRRLPRRAAVFLDTPQATGVRWSGCRDGSEVVHFRINGGDHQAPRTIAGRPFAQVAWDFFAAHPLPG
jgi:poly(3-hydroxybutyrate) depolymerase